jgi:hypothetical protein
MLELHNKHQLNCATNILFDINGIYGINSNFHIFIKSETEAQLAIREEDFKNQSKLKYFHMEIVRQLYFSCMYDPTRKLELLKKYKYQDLETYNFNRQFKITTLIASISAFMAIVSAILSIFSFNSTQNIHIINKELKVESTVKSIPEQKFYFSENIDK